MPASDSSSFGEVVERLDKIVSEVRAKDVSLERSLDLLDEAIRLGSRAVELVDSTDLSAEELTRRVPLPPEYLEAASELHGLLASDPDTLILETTGRYDFNAEGALRHWTEEYAM